MTVLRLRPALFAVSMLVTVLLLSAESPAAAVPATCGLAAHRGDHSRGATENSLNAMRDAIIDGADYLELDVRTTKDGHLFLMHDRTVDRTTNGTGAIGNMTAAQVRALRLDDGERVPSLSAVLALAKPTSVYVLPEMKGMRGRATYRALAAQVRNFGTSRIRVTSFSPRRLNRLNAVAPHIHELLNTGRQVSRAQVKPYGAVAINVDAVTNQWIQQMTSFSTFVYGSDTAAQWDQYASMVTGVITNAPIQFEQNRPIACPPAG